MAARALHPESRKARKGNPNPSPSTRFKPGQSGNPGGKSPEQKQAEVALRELATAFGAASDPNDLERRPRGIVALNELYSLGIGGNVPALTAFCDRVGLKPIDRAEITGDGFVFSIRKRIHGDDGTDGASG